MKVLAVIVSCVLFLSSCDLNQYTKVYIDNQNNYPIDVKIETANISSMHRVEANATLDTLRKYTDIELVDGTWNVTINNANTGQGKTYEHGNFYKGILAINFTVRTKGSYVEFSVDN